MGNFNLNNGKAKNFKNKSSPSVTKFTDIDLNIKNMLEKFIYKNFPHDVDSEGNIFFKFIYDKLPPKTKRIKMYEKTPYDKFHINQKDIVVYFNNDNTIKTEIIYKVSNNDFMSFQKKLSNILNNNNLFDSKYYIGDFKNRNKTEKELLKCLSIICEIKKVNEINNLPKISTVKIVKIYDMYDNLRDILKNIGIKCEIEINNTIVLTPDQYEILKLKMPWLISRVLETTELSDNILDDFQIPDQIKIPSNKINSQLIGVIDSGMNLGGDFSKFIDNYIKDIEPNGNSNYEHGNRVASLIIAYDQLNDDKDNLGNFKIRHFETTSLKPNNKGTASVNVDFLSRRLQDIIKKNTDIKVWNISIGALKKEKNNKLLSYESIILDKLAQEYDCLFIVSSGNYRETHGEDSLCSPADALNCLSVGSVTIDKNNNVIPSNFSSIGVAMHCRKPEVSTFGGPVLFNGKTLKSLGSFDIVKSSSGTSFAAPKIARLAAYLIEKGYTPLEAKSAIINLANRETTKNISSLFGYVKDYKNEVTSLKTTLIFGQNDKIKYFDINLDKVDNVSIAWSNYANSLPSLGEEYSISNFEVDLIKYPKKWDLIPYDKKGNKSYTPEFHKIKLELKINSAWKTKYLPESGRRLYNGKYFTSHKEEYDVLNNEKSIKSYEQADYNYAIRIKRQELFETQNVEPLKIGINIMLSGKNFKEEEFIINNSSLIEIKDYESYIDIELEKNNSL